MRAQHDAARPMSPRGTKRREASREITTTTRKETRMKAFEAAVYATRHSGHTYVVREVCQSVPNCAELFTCEASNA